MSELKKKFDELRRTAELKVKEIDEQFGISDKLEDGAKFAQDTFKETAKVASGVASKGAETIIEGAEKLKNEAEKFVKADDFGEQAKETAKKAGETVGGAARKAKDFGEEAAKMAQETVKEAGKKAHDFGEKVAEATGTEEVFEKANDVFNETSEKAGEIFRSASEKVGEVYTNVKETFESATKTASDTFYFGKSWATIFDSALKNLNNTTAWISENPAQAVGTGVSMFVGAGLGIGMATFSSNWLFNSALPVYSLKKASESFETYLKHREELLTEGELDTAETERVKFERDIAKYIGAPLLGAFSCAAGATMFANILSPKTITGAPISWLLGGNPLLEGIWLFGNGVICFQIGYEFFMIALEDQTEVQRIVREIKGFLPVNREV